MSLQVWEVDYIRAARRTASDQWEFRVKVGYCLHEADLTQSNTVALRSWEPQESLIDCAYALNEFLENSSFKFIENDGSEYFEGKANWLKEKAKAAKDRDAGKPPNPEPTLLGAGIDPEASTLWKTPKDFGMDADDRTLSYEVGSDITEDHPKLNDGLLDRPL
ncbi:hypothetical protein PQX77_002232 [Marasmius sp. AFHP31]|nr:hypothetical protein PQX77_002232 [Marasmius sp. AFHP31]